MSFEYIQVPNESALLEIEKLRNDFSISKKYPFLIGKVREFDTFSELDKEQTTAIILKSKNLDSQTWFKDRETEIRDEDWFDYDELLGDWEDLETEKQITSFVLRENKKDKIDSIHIGLADIEEPWMLPAFLRYGGWNECPSPEVQCSIMRHWQKEYGAEIFSVSDDVIECTVKNPPQTETSALKLAWEQYLFCADIVDQGTETLSALGSELLNSKLWFFWWD